MEDLKIFHCYECGYSHFDIDPDDIGILLARNSFIESINLRCKILRDDNFLITISNISNIIIEGFRRGNKIIVFGNGGSQADAQHMVSELVGRMIYKNLDPFSAIVLSDSSVITSLANDYGYSEIFSKQIVSIGKENDIVIAISTSGKSLNILRALEEAKKIGMIRIGLTGGDGGEIPFLSDYYIVVPSNSTQKIQEVHKEIIHIICRTIELKYNDK